MPRGYGGSIGAKGEKKSVPKRQQASIAEQKVEAEQRHSVGHERNTQADVIGVGELRHGGQRDHGQEYCSLKPPAREPAWLVVAQRCGVA